MLQETRLTFSTIRLIAFRILCRVSSFCVLMSSNSSAESGMMLSDEPAWMLPTVTTAVSCGSTSRATIPCRRTTMLAAMSTGSMHSCGMLPCPPRPCTVILKLSAEAIMVPALTATLPARPGWTCCARTTSGLGILP